MIENGCFLETTGITEVIKVIVGTVFIFILIFINLGARRTPHGIQGILLVIQGLLFEGLERLYEMLRKAKCKVSVLSLIYISVP